MSSAVPASIQYTVSLVTLPIARAGTLSRPALSALRWSLRQELLSLASVSKKSFQISIRLSSRTPPPSFFLVASKAAEFDWGSWLLHLGGKPLELIITRDSVVANGRNVWKADKPMIPSEAVALLGLEKKAAVAPVAQAQKKPMLPITPQLKGLELEDSEANPITPMTGLPTAMLLRSPSPFSDESSSDEEDETFSDVSSEASDDNLAAVPIRRLSSPLSTVQPAARSVKAYKYAEGETIVLSGGVKLGLPSVAHNHPSMSDDDDEFEVLEEQPRPVKRPQVSAPISKLQSLLARRSAEKTSKARQTSGASNNTNSWRSRA